MRTKVALCMLAAFAMSSPAMGAIGAIHFDLKSGGSDADIVLLQGAGAVIPIDVFFSTDASGTSGSNRGKAGGNISINTNLPIVDQSPFNIPQTLTNPHNANAASTTVGLGFKSFVDGGALQDNVGDAGKETIDSIGAFQGLSPDFDFTNTNGVLKHKSAPEGVGHPGGNPWPGDNVGAAPVLFAFGSVLVDPSTPAGTYVMQLTVNSAKVWDHTPGEAQTQDVPGLGDTLTLIIVPEPATMLLLAPAAWVLRRRRNAQ